MSNKKAVKESTETLEYIMTDDHEFVGVIDSSALMEFIIEPDGNVHVTAGEIDKDKFDELCIAWLLLKHPDNVIKHDDDQSYDDYLIGRLEDAVTLIKNGNHHMAIASLLADISLLKSPDNKL